MIFGSSNGKRARDGKLTDWFLKRYDEYKNKSSNVGWTLINDVIQVSHLLEFSHFPRKKF